MQIHNTDETVPLKVTCGSHGVDEMLQGGAQLPLLLLLQAIVQGVEDDHPQLCHRLQYHSFLIIKDDHLQLLHSLQCHTFPIIQDDYTLIRHHL
jgi:hypothetical protein